MNNTQTALLSVLVILTFTGTFCEVCTYFEITHISSQIGRFQTIEPDYPIWSWLRGISKWLI